MKYPYFQAACSNDIDNINHSSSGGIFFELAKHFIEQGGVVYGAVQKDIMHVEHTRAAAIGELMSLRRSKYLKSSLNGCLSNVKEDLKEGKTVLFSGVGCQIAALYQLLSEEYGRSDKLTTCEVVCHGVPYTEAYEKYIQEKEADMGDKLIGINFRDKRMGWLENCISEQYKSGKENVVPSRLHPVHSLYIQGINMSAGCASCQYAGLPRIADITLADYWQYDGRLKEANRDRGITLVAVNSAKGDLLFQSIQGQITAEEATKESALNSCRHMSNPPYLHPSQNAFRRLLSEGGFQYAYDICIKFGEINTQDKLQIVPKADVGYIFDIFAWDTQEVIYVEDMKKRITGIITFGDFVKNYINGTGFINTKYCYAELSENCTDEIKRLFEANNKINRIPVLDQEKHLHYEVKRDLGANGKKDIRKNVIPFLELHECGVESIYVNRPDLMETCNYTEREAGRISNGYSFSVLQERIEDHQGDFMDIFKEKFSEEYIMELCKIPPIFQAGNRYRHLDSSSKLVNVIGGQRVTAGQPDGYTFTLHIYGRCGVFGYAVEDKETLPSALQYILNQNGFRIRVENHGLWGADDEKIFQNMRCDLKEGVIQKGDLVVLYMAYLPDECNQMLDRLGVLRIDTTEPFHKYLKAADDTFYDRPGHMTAQGYAFIAEYMFRCLSGNHLLNPAEGDRVNRKQSNPLVKKNYEPEIAEYVNSIKLMLPSEQLQGLQNIGAIIMHCNPFTKGHRYLIETARKSVDLLLLFVLEEDQSFFSFKDRFEMVKLGTEDLEDVYVLPSGKFIVSSLTFPEYFVKDQKPDILINAAEDVEIFANYIAPALGISKRFVGTEPIDQVTAQYNQLLKTVLPRYGIELIEIERLQGTDGVVTATKVREYLRKKEYKKLKELLPDSTYYFIMKDRS